MISVIVPIYNTEKYLDRCIQSILSQTYTDFELLLIDDGSTDNSGTICDQYAAKDSRIRVFHKANGGVSSARNLGLDNACGEWITFVDADDWLDLGLYHTVFNSNYNADIIFISNIEHLEDGTVVKYQANVTYSNTRSDIENTILYLKKNLADYPFYGFTWNKIFKSSIINKNKIRFLENFALYEDELFTNEYCKYIYSIIVLSDTLYHYRRSSSGLTNQERKADDLLVLTKKIIENSRNYYLKDLIIYEQKRALTFLIQAISVDKKQAWTELILSMIREFSNSTEIEIGKRLKILLMLGTRGGKLLLRYYYALLGKTFV